METLIYGNDKGELIARELPFLGMRKKWEISVNSPIFSVMLSKDSRFLIVGCGDGEFSVVTDPNITTNTYKKIEEVIPSSPDEVK